MMLCDSRFSQSMQLNKLMPGDNLPYCLALREYTDCLLGIQNPCRGDIRYHSFSTLTKQYLRKHNCTAILRAGNLSPSASSSSKSSSKSSSFKTLKERTQDGQCLFPYHHRTGPSGYRHCGVFGDPHLRTFNGQQETCKTLGAWPLVDNAYLAVQVTNDPVAPGLDASGITKITVIVRSLPGCTTQKTYEATQDGLPSAFVDGSSRSSNGEKSLHSGGHGNGHSHSRSAVFIRTIVPHEHIEIVLRYVATKLSIRRVGGYLTFAIRVPDEVIQERSSVSTLQLCLSGCPSGERIKLKEVLADPPVYVRTLGLDKPRMARDKAIELCRDAGVTDFYFDSCVFDLLTTGDTDFLLAASKALDDVRTLYPPYSRHYEMNRTDLGIYEVLTSPIVSSGEATKKSLLLTTICSLVLLLVQKYLLKR